MSLNTKQEKLRFWRNWTLLNALVIILLYPIGGIIILITFILGSLLYGAITGATLIWILQPKEIKS